MKGHDSEAQAVHYVHLPGVRLAEGSPVDVLGGRLEPFDFDEFERLDADWAGRTYFERTQPVVWTCSLDPAAFDDPIAEFAYAAEAALLVYYAVLMQTEYFIPDPRMSVRYRSSGADTFRTVGPLGRTTLLVGDGSNVLGPEDLQYVARRAAMIEEARLRSSDQVFGPLRALSFLAIRTLPYELAVAPLMVSLEGFLLGQKTADSKPVALTKRVRELLAGAAPPDVDQYLARIYRWRNEVIHGQSVTEHDIEHMLLFLSWLTRAVVWHAVELTAAGANPNRLPIGQEEEEAMDDGSR